MKTNQPLVSIIVPIYNVEQYLRKSLDSIVNQSYTNIEVILVNDGSTDSSTLIAQRFIDLDARFKLILQENKGLSGARNTGLEHATGDYIFYLDSDDYLVDNAIQLLIEAAEEHDADIVQGNFYYDYPTYLLINKQQKEEIRVYNREQAMWALLEHKTVLNFAWGKLIKREIAQRYLFPEGKFYEDTFWKYKIIHDSEKYVALKQPVLYYLQRGSAISGAFSIRNLDQLEGELERLEFLKKYYPKQFEIQALKLLHHKVQHHYDLLVNLAQKDQEMFKEKLQEIETTLQLKEKFPNTTSGLMKNMNRITQGIKYRLWGFREWKRIYK